VDTRALIRDAVAARNPVDERERLSVELFLRYFDVLAEPCSEHAGPVHVTGSAIIVGARGVVLHLHKRLQLWLQPGGHIEPGETPWDAAKREAEEETGLDVEFVSGTEAADGSDPELGHVDVHPGPRGHTHLDLRYFLQAPAVDPSPPPGESQDVRWFGWDDAIVIADPGLSGALVAYRGRFERRNGTCSS
jgi:8-oxo-dGTP pyrophosphatase MutT (NUDIX family)